MHGEGGMGRGFSPTDIANWTLWQINMAMHNADQLKGTKTFDDPMAAKMFSLQRKEQMAKKAALKFAEFDADVIEFGTGG